MIPMEVDLSAIIAKYCPIDSSDTDENFRNKYSNKNVFPSELLDTEETNENDTF